MGPRYPYWNIGGIRFFRKNREIIAQGGPQPKRDIVDTKTHATCARGQNTNKQKGFPTTWGRTGNSVETQRAQYMKINIHVRLQSVVEYYCQYGAYL